MNDERVHPPEWKQKLFEEMRSLGLLTVFLVFFFCAFTTYRKLIIGDQSVNYINYAYNIVQSLLLAKIILLGQFLKLGERFLDKPLIIPALYKTLVFCVFVFVFSVAEHFIKGILTGKNIEMVFNEFASASVNEILGRFLIYFPVFLFLFGYIELGRVLGKDKLFALFFGNKT